MPQEMPNQLGFVHIGPSLLNADLIKRELAILILRRLGRKRFVRFVVVDFNCPIRLLGEAVNVTLKFVFARPIEVDHHTMLKCQRRRFVERRVSRVVPSQAFLADAAIIIRRILGTDNADALVKTLSPIGAEVYDDLLNGQQLAAHTITIQFLERIMHAGTEERFDRLLFFDFHLGNVLAVVPPRTLLVG